MIFAILDSYVVTAVRMLTGRELLLCESKRLESLQIGFWKSLFEKKSLAFFAQHAHKHQQLLVVI